MSLIGHIEAIAEHLPPSHLPSPFQALTFVGALIAYAEHGQPLIDAANHPSDPWNEVQKVITGGAHNVEQFVVHEVEQVAKTEYDALLSELEHLRANSTPNAPASSAPVSSLSGGTPPAAPASQPADPTGFVAPVAP